MLVFLGYVVRLGVRLGQTIIAWQPWFVLVPVLGGAIVAAYLAADFVSGFVHYLGDTYGDEATPFFGPNFIKPFRIHHVDPKEITRHNFFEVNGSNCLISLVVLIPLYHLVSFTTPWHVMGALGIWFFIVFIFATNQIHKWAHANPENVPAFVKWLQNKSIILSPTHHQTHHTAPYATYYCITNGWLNPLLARIHFFEKITQAVKKK